MNLQYGQCLGILLPRAKCHQFNLADATSGLSQTLAWGLSATHSSDGQTEVYREKSAGSGALGELAALLVSKQSPFSLGPQSERQTPPQGCTVTDGLMAGCRRKGALSPNIGQLPSF